MDRRTVEGRSLVKVLAQARENGGLALIVDVKRRSPRDGLLISDEYLEPYVRALNEAGVDALSTPTERRYFGGSIDTARRIREFSNLPLMRKEFFGSTAQMDESLHAGFDAVQLTLSSIADLDLAKAMKDRAEEIGLEVVVCVNGAKQLDSAVDLGARIIGIANRDINFLELDAGTGGTTEGLIRDVPDHIYTISESSLFTAADVAKMAAAGADGVIVGTAVAKSQDPGATIRTLRGENPECKDPVRQNR